MRKNTSGEKKPQGNKKARRKKITFSEHPRCLLKMGRGKDLSRDS